MAKINPVIIVVCLLFVPGIALAIPGIPNQFYGHVNYNNSQPAQDGLAVTAKIDDAVVASAVTSGGWYSVMVRDDKNNHAGDVVHFFVSGIDTGKTGIFQTGSVTQIDLALPFGPPPVYTPPAVQPPTQATTNGGGGTGGSPSGTASGSRGTNATNQTREIIEQPAAPPACQEKWSCTGWGTCDNGKSARTCTDANRCGTELNKPFETQPCSSEEMTATQTVSPATGLFTFSNTSTILGLILALALIAGILFRKKLFPRASAPAPPPVTAAAISPPPSPPSQPQEPDKVDPSSQGNAGSQ